jgi:hypothetical protein
MSRRRLSFGVGGAVVVVRLSEREAGAAERAPEALEIVDRRSTAPGAAVAVPVDTAGAGAAARLIELLAVHLPATLVAPGGVTAEPARRRPFRHRRRRRRVEAREDAGRVNDFAADDRQLGNGIGNVALRAGEIIAIRNDQVGELAGL